MPMPLSHSPIFGDLFGDAAFAEIFSDAQDVARMIEVERCLAKVQGQLGVIPGDAAAAIDTALEGLALDPSVLAKGASADGVPVPLLVAGLRAQVPEDHGRWLHWGATSQDVIDTAMMMAVTEALDVINGRLQGITQTLRSQASAYQDVVMAGRTRGQVATPITFGLRIAQWAQPLMQVALPGAMPVQFGGAVGSNAAVAPTGPEVATGLADALGLVAAPPWHTDRSVIRDFADRLCQILVALGKMAGDMILMQRSEIAELRAGAGGVSSTMPQKSNPVGAEAIQTLMHLGLSFRGGLSVPHAEERDGAAWAVEWALLPQIVITVGAALSQAQVLAETMTPDVDRMRDNLTAHPGAMAEAASLALAQHMPMDAAKTMVKQALAAGDPLAEALAKAAPVDLDWTAILNPDAVIEPCAEVIQTIFRELK